LTFNALTINVSTLGRRLVMRRPHAYSRTTRTVAEMLGTEIAVARRQRKTSAEELAGRAGISPGTLRRAERGDPDVSAGILFELCVLLGVPLYTPDPAELRRMLSWNRDRLTLLPTRIRHTENVDDDF
jgi:transcriptional regulator with XRE-family HTH domain